MARTFPNNASNRLNMSSDVTLLKLIEQNHDVSIHAWVKLVSTANEQTIVSKGLTSGRGFLMRVTTSAKLGCFWLDSGGGGQEAISATSFTAGSWTSCGFSRLASSGVAFCYFNGVQDGTDTGTMTAGSVSATWQAGSRSGGGQPLNGDAAAIAIWDTVLTPDQFAALSKGASPHLVAPNPIGYWPLWGLTTTEPDLSGNINTWGIIGTLAVANQSPLGPYAPAAT